jgi:hypothetical protein
VSSISQTVSVLYNVRFVLGLCKEVSATAVGYVVESTKLETLT